MKKPRQLSKVPKIQEEPSTEESKNPTVSKISAKVAMAIFVALLTAGINPTATSKAKASTDDTTQVDKNDREKIQEVINDALRRLSEAGEIRITTNEDVVSNPERILYYCTQAHRNPLTGTVSEVSIQSQITIFKVLYDILAILKKNNIADIPLFLEGMRLGDIPTEFEYPEQLDIMRGNPRILEARIRQGAASGMGMRSGTLFHSPQIRLTSVEEEYTHPPDATLEEFRAVSSQFAGRTSVNFSAANETFNLPGGFTITYQELLDLCDRAETLVHEVTDIREQRVVNLVNDSSSPVGLGILGKGHEKALRRLCAQHNILLIIIDSTRTESELQDLLPQDEPTMFEQILETIGQLRAMVQQARSAGR